MSYVSDSQMNTYLRRTAEILLPSQVLATIRAIRSRNQQMRLSKEWGIHQATREMIDSYGLTVLHGPFRGMRYSQTSLVHSSGIPIVFGTYELELQPIIEEVVSNKYDCVVDIGSAEGYYAVGLALRMHTTVHAFDCEPREMRFLRQIAKLNSVTDLIKTGSWCKPAVLSRLVDGRRCLIISDCEGYEIDLFNEQSVAASRHSDLIVEVHEKIPGRNVKSELLKRFHTSHNHQVITFSSGDLSSRVPHRWQGFAREFRSPGQQWLFFTSKSSA
jgi:Met-10+ like-protein